MVVGIGGAGGAIACALCEVGIARLVLVDLNNARLLDLGAKLKLQFPAVRIDFGCDTLAGLDLIAQATPMGMQPGDPLPLPPALLDTLTARTLVGDAITVPAITPLLALAQARGCKVQTGLEMSRASMEFLGGFLGVMPAVDPVALVAAPLP